MFICQPTLPALLYLWDKRTLYLGPLRSPAQLSLVASRLLVSLAGEIRFREKTQTLDCFSRSLLLPVGWQGQVDTGGGLVADCHLDVSGFDHALLLQLAQRREQGAAYDLSLELLLQQSFRSIYQHPPAPLEVCAQLQQLLNPPGPAGQLVFRFDPRVWQTIQRIKTSQLHNHSVAWLAQQVDLSSSRLLSLFKGQVGVPIRRYRLWYRLLCATQQMTTGSSVTEAAVHAGFADAAHFARTYREILGFHPSALSLHPALRVFVGATIDESVTCRTNLDGCGKHSQFVQVGLGSEA
jgi:AraC-like DNA-binding protein